MSVGLCIEYTIITGNEVQFQIKEQLYRGDEFNQQADLYYESVADGDIDNFIRFESMCVPEGIEWEAKLYVRGELLAHDNDRLSCSFDYFKKLKRSIARFNEVNNCRDLSRIDKVVDIYIDGQIYVTCEFN